MPKGYVMSKKFVLKPMKDTMIDYTWRVNGRDIVICPECKKHGTPRRTADDAVIMIHKEIASDYRAPHLVEFCETVDAMVHATLVRKEKARQVSYELAQKRRADKAAGKTARHKKFLLEHYGSGQSIVEFALLIPFLCLLLFGTLDIGRLIQAQSRIGNASHLAMRDVQNVVNGNDTTAVSPVAVETAVAGNFPGVTVDIYPLSTVTSNEAVVITTTTQFHMITPFVRNMVGVSTIKQVVTGTTLP